MPAITRKWRKLFAVGCSHGPLIDPLARVGVLKFIDAWKPDVRIHLGDFSDMTAFRSGAKGTSDEGEPIGPDIDEGLRFLKEIRATHVFTGNHEDRLYRLRNHHNAVIAECAASVIERIQTRCALQKAELIETYSITHPDSYRVFGGVKFFHGFMYSENACRDHAEAFGSCVFAHTHRAGVAKGRRTDSPAGYCVGTLTKIVNMDYAKSRRATMSWGQGCVWGEFCDDKAVLWLHEQPKQISDWRLPV